MASVDLAPESGGETCDASKDLDEAEYGVPNLYFGGETVDLMVHRPDRPGTGIFDSLRLPGLIE